MNGSSAFARLGGRVQARVAALVGRPVVWASFFAVVTVVLMGRTMMREIPQPPKLDMPLPAFTLTDETGLPFGSADLRGKVWVASFVFTTCPSVCPKLMERVAELQHRGRNMGEAFHLVTITVDPENDTPAKMAAFASPYRPNPRRWKMLTGPLGDVEKAVIDGFKITMEKEEVEHGLFSIVHGEHLVVVDQKGHIRGYYEASDEGLDKLMRDVGILVNLP